MLQTGTRLSIDTRTLPPGTLFSITHSLYEYTPPVIYDLLISQLYFNRLLRDISLCFTVKRFNSTTSDQSWSALRGAV